MMDIFLIGLLGLWASGTYFLVWVILHEHPDWSDWPKRWRVALQWSIALWPVGLFAFLLARVWVEEVWPRILRSRDWLIEALGD